MPTTKKIEHPDDVLFDNAPLFDHLPRKDRPMALQQHRFFEKLLREQPDDRLHFSLTGEHVLKPRQTIAHLVVKYCHKHHVPLGDLLTSITKAGGDVAAPALLKSRKSDQKGIVNLLCLENEVLWQVYLSLPNEFKTPVKTKMPIDPTAPRKQKRRVKFDGTVVMPKRPKLAPAEAAEPQPVFRDVCWACCDLCDKWRRVPGSEADLPDRWVCGDHPSGCLTCETPEEEMEEEEKWDGETAGRTEPTTEQLAEMEMHGNESDSGSAQASTSEMPASQGPSEEGMGDDDDKDEHEDAVDDAELWGDDDEY